MWAILSMYFVWVDSVAFLGDYPDRETCLVALHEAELWSGRETPPDLRQCVYVDRAKVDEFNRINEADYQIRQRSFRDE